MIIRQTIYKKKHTIGVSTYHRCTLYTYGMRTYGMRTYGMRTYGMRTYGMRTYGMRTYDLRYAYLWYGMGKKYLHLLLFIIFFVRHGAT